MYFDDFQNFYTFLVIDNAVLTLLHQQPHEVAEVGAELLPVLTGGCERIFSGFLFELLRHTSDDIPVFHVCLHLAGDLPLATGRRDKELHQL